MRRWPLLLASLILLLRCQASEAPEAPPADGGALPVDSGRTLEDTAANPRDVGGDDAARDAARDAPLEADAGELRCQPASSPPRVRVELMATGLVSPWSMVFLPNGDMLVTEREGRIRILRKGGTLEPQPVPGSPPTVYEHHAGYMGLALHPDFPAKPFVYLAFAHVFPGPVRTVSVRISRLRWESERFVDELPLLDSAHDDDTLVNAGGRLAFGRDKKLYATIGERSLGGVAQDLSTLYGKIVRLEDDGRIPADNPFVGRPDARPEIYSYGHRNPQGLALRPSSRELYSSEHGGAGGDEINLIEPGKNYGYPDIVRDASAPGVVSPLLEFTPAIAPSGATFYASNTLLGWCGDLFVACLVGEQILRVHFPASGPPTAESLFKSQYGRIRDVAQSPDGYLYFAEDAFSGAHIWRIVPE